jgi:hypothetical protein
MSSFLFFAKDPLKGVFELTTKVPENYLSLIFCFMFMVLFDNIFYTSDEKKLNIVYRYFKISNFSEIFIGVICCVIMFFLNGTHYDGIWVSKIALSCGLIVLFLKGIRFVLMLKLYIY